MAKQVKQKESAKKEVKKEKKVENIDANGTVMGRLASVAAQKLLAGYEVNIYNAENAVITGSEDDIVATYYARLQYRAKGDPEFKPKYYRTPDKILKTATRKMLPHNKPRGMEAERRLKVFNKNPDNVKLVSYDDAKIKKGIRCLSLERLCIKLGAKW